MNSEVRQVCWTIVLGVGHLRILLKVLCASALAFDFVDEERMPVLLPHRLLEELVDIFWFDHLFILFLLFNDFLIDSHPLRVLFDIGFLNSYVTSVASK